MCETLSAPAGKSIALYLVIFSSMTVTYGVQRRRYSDQLIESITQDLVASSYLWLHNNVFAHMYA